MEPAVCYDGFTAVLYRNTGACPVDGTFGDGGGVYVNSDSCVSLVSSRVSYRESSDVHIVAGDCNDRFIILSVDDGVILLLPSEINGFIDGDCFVVYTVEHVHGVAVCCIEDAVADVLIWVVV